LKENYKKILIIMMPVIPHLINECLSKLYNQNEYQWPSVNKEFIKNENANIVIQINGKKRSVLEFAKNMGEEKLVNYIKDKKLLENYFEKKIIVKIIYIKDRLINFILK